MEAYRPSRDKQKCGNKPRALMVACDLKTIATTQENTVMLLKNLSVQYTHLFDPADKCAKNYFIRQKMSEMKQD